MKPSRVLAIARKELLHILHDFRTWSLLPARVPDNWRIEPTGFLAPVRKVWRRP